MGRLFSLRLFFTEEHASQCSPIRGAKYQTFTKITASFTQLFFDLVLRVMTKCHFKFISAGMVTSVEKSCRVVLTDRAYHAGNLETEIPLTVFEMRLSFYDKNMKMRCHRFVTTTVIQRCQLSRVLQGRNHVLSVMVSNVNGSSNREGFSGLVYGRSFPVKYAAIRDCSVFNATLFLLWPPPRS